MDYFILFLVCSAAIFILYTVFIKIPAIRKAAKKKKDTRVRFYDPFDDYRRR
jgi:hypothetical protein